MIKKAVIPVAGLGTRLLPATKAIPKEMLPVVDKPLIQYIVDECIAAGITQIVLVTHSSKNAIENHFDTSYELESTLEKRVKRQLLSEVRGICPDNVVIMHVRQGVAKGLGHAILCAQPLIGDAPFAVVLPDVLLNAYSFDAKTDNLAAMLKRYDETGFSQVMVSRVPDADVSKYGIVECEQDALAVGKHALIKQMIEKPKAEDTTSRLAIVGRYVLSAGIWASLQKTPVGAGDEVQLTDALTLLNESKELEAYYNVGSFHDCGNKQGYLEAIVDYGLRHPELGGAFKTYLKTNVDKERGK